MIEIRPIRLDESEPFLHVLCDTFSLDFERAYTVFFNEPMFDVQRKWALFEDRKIVSILTTVPLEFGWGKAIGIAGVATVEGRRCEGLASQLLNRAVEECAKNNGEEAAFLFAKETTVYQRNGFEVLDKVVRAPIVSEFREPPPALSNEEVGQLYNNWAAAHPDRLRRTPHRWSYWRWTMKVCTPFRGGYLCTEGTHVREAICHDLMGSWPVPKNTDWFGLANIAAQMGVPFAAKAKPELILMGRRSPGVPQMFMTDQF